MRLMMRLWMIEPLSRSGSFLWLAYDGGSGSGRGGGGGRGREGRARERERARRHEEGWDVRTVAATTSHRQTHDFQTSCICIVNIQIVSFIQLNVYRVNLKDKKQQTEKPLA